MFIKVSHGEHRKNKWKSATQHTKTRQSVTSGFLLRHSPHGHPHVQNHRAHHIRNPRGCHSQSRDCHQSRCIAGQSISSALQRRPSLTHPGHLGRHRVHLLLHTGLWSLSVSIRPKSQDHAPRPPPPPPYIPISSSWEGTSALASRKIVINSRACLALSVVKYVKETPFWPARCERACKFSIGYRINEAYPGATYPMDIVFAVVREVIVLRSSTSVKNQMTGTRQNWGWSTHDDISNILDVCTSQNRHQGQIHPAASKNSSMSIG
jgi:hypothetical protein